MMNPTNGARTVDDHRRELLGPVAALPPVTLPLASCRGLTLSADLVARVPVPPFTNSSMDGYAVRAADVAPADVDHPVELPVIGDCPAGAAAGVFLEPGSAIRIMTGAPLPAGADAVVPVEMTDQRLGPGETPRSVRIHQAVLKDAYVRFQGEAVSIGTSVLALGTVMTPAALAAAGAVGHGELSVVPRPRVAILSTGNELSVPGDVLRPGAIPDSNLVMLAALVEEWGGDVTLAERVSDNPPEFRAAIARAVDAADLVVTSGGISAGAFEVVRQSLDSPRVQFVSVAMQPGKPQGFGTLTRGSGEDVPLIALPGNPVSSFVSFHVFVRPVLARLAGRDPLAETTTIEVRVVDGWRSPAGRRQYVPVRLEGPREPYDARPTHPLGSASHLVGSLHLAHALAVVPAHVTQVEAGESLSAHLLGQLALR